MINDEKNGGPSKHVDITQMMNKIQDLLRIAREKPVVMNTVLVYWVTALRITYAKQRQRDLEPLTTKIIVLVSLCHVSRNLE